MFSLSCLDQTYSTNGHVNPKPCINMDTGIRPSSPGSQDESTGTVMLVGNTEAQDPTGLISSSVQTIRVAPGSDGVHALCPANLCHSNDTVPPACEMDSTQTAAPFHSTDSDGSLTTGALRDQTNHAGWTASSGGQAQMSVQPDTGLPFPSEEPPPYSPPDPKTAYLFYPSQPPIYSGPPVIACQPGPNQPAFYQAQFMPSPSYPPYTIYMNGLPLGEEQPPQPKDYMVESLLVTIFCCLMSGLVALMYSYETRAALARGDIRDAERASQKARLLVVFSLMFGIFVCVGWVIYVVIALCA